MHQHFSRIRTLQLISKISMKQNVELSRYALAQGSPSPKELLGLHQQNPELRVRNCSTLELINAVLGGGNSLPAFTPLSIDDFLDEAGDDDVHSEHTVKVGYKINYQDSRGFEDYIIPAGSRLPLADIPKSARQSSKNLAQQKTLTRRYPQRTPIFEKFREFILENFDQPEANSDVLVSSDCRIEALRLIAKLETFSDFQPRWISPTADGGLSFELSSPLGKMLWEIDDDCELAVRVGNGDKNSKYFSLLRSEVKEFTTCFFEQKL